MDITQTVLLSILIVITVFIVILGFQVFFVLRDLRKTLARLSQLLDHTEDLVGQVRRPIESAGNFFTALTAGASLAHLLRRGKKENKDDRSEK